MLSLIWVRTVSAWLLALFEGIPLGLTLFPLVRVFKTGGAEPFRTFEIPSMIWFLIFSFWAPSYFFLYFQLHIFLLSICIRSLKLSAALSKWCLAECPFWLCWCSVGFSLRIVSYARTRSRTERTRALAAYWRILQGPGCYRTALCLPACFAGCVRAKCGHFAMTNLLHVRAPAGSQRTTSTVVLFNDCTLGKII